MSLLINIQEAENMPDQISGITAKEAGSSPDVNNEVDAEAFQSMLLKGGLMLMQSMQSDATDALSDNTSNPDAPF
ncbi:hypothetical protein AA0313_1964 [Acetobacter indonesiensis NRIC 0313]|uniref:Uncharacterized protein n=2 Tax=Acetobacter indonesiensis TaxID=104101 RepID=A0A6N3TA70_9PROT|nr:hypothetical protein AA0313_1964 [Acetobacter indonesiensis NRIC 0313]GEN04737.1 hypothetical protein AIN02nite_27620 [Acetobacter indonesiensis]